MTTTFLGYLEDDDRHIELVTCDECGVVLTYWTQDRHEHPEPEPYWSSERWES